MSLKDIAVETTPGWQVRLALLQRGADYERERIIKLLEEYDAEIRRDSIIARIKGEAE